MSTPRLELVGTLIGIRITCPECGSADVRWFDLPEQEGFTREETALTAAVDAHAAGAICWPECPDCPMVALEPSPEVSERREAARWRRRNSVHNEATVAVERRA
jgi:hypothetical protein